MYSGIGRPSVPPEQLLKATILMALYSVRSERAFCERLNYDLLFKWFLDLPIDAKAFDRRPSPRTGNGSWALRSRIGSSRRSSGRRSSAATCRAITSRSTGRCWRRGRPTRASSPRMVPAGRGAVGPQRRGRLPGPEASNQTHRSTTDPEALLARKSKQHPGAALLRRAPADGEPPRPDRRHGAHPGRRLRRAGQRHRDAQATASPGRRAHGGRRQGLRHRRLRRRLPRPRRHPPRRAEHDDRRSAIDGRTTRHPGHRISQRLRPRIEEPFGWIKTVAGGRKLRYRGRQRNRAWFLLAGATYNLIRI